MGRDVRIRCGNCQLKWDAPGYPADGYHRNDLETKPCPGCGACTLAVSSPEPPKRRGRTVRSFVVPKRMAVAA